MVYFLSRLFDQKSFMGEELKKRDNEFKDKFICCIMPITSTHPTKIRFPKKDIQQDRENILKKSNRHFVYLK